jgi:hypothetical protein
MNSITPLPGAPITPNAVAIGHVNSKATLRPSRPASASVNSKQMLPGAPIEE